MVLEYDVTKKDYENVIYSDLKKKKRLSGIGFSIFIIPILLVAIDVILMYQDDLNNPFLILLIVGMVFLMLLPIFLRSRKVQAKLILRERIKNGELEKVYFGHHVLEVKDDRLLLKYKNLEGERLYGGIDRVTQYKGAVAIFTSQVNCDIIPNSAFRDSEERSSFISLIQSRMAAAKDVPIDENAIEKDSIEAKYTVNYSWDEKSLINSLVAASRLHYRTKLAWTAGQVILSVASLLLFVRFITMVGEYLIGALFALLISLLLQINIISVFTPWIYQITQKRIQNGIIRRDMVGNHAMFIYEDKIKIQSRLSAQDFEIRQIYCISLVKDNLIILLKDKTAVTVPGSAFSSEGELREIMKFVEQKTLTSH